ncbi:pseudoazurin [Chelativorans intermedius]|uniref:Pseudoazurin n=1 Tax=Chelativorans intermedius TaxID=515947 RepID=A0ABV6DBD9_9HYPH|nr:pseudoazurin [Chelativorans intermedius]MCT9000264.1 pseudoazurin [Chelativorans intermedius]
MRAKHMRVALLCAAATAGAGVASASAETATIEMLNKKGDERFVYSAPLVRVEPGDTLRIAATDKGHNAVSIDGMLPAGAEPINVPFNKDGEITLTEPGVYGIKCTPHVGLGMVALVVVGDPANLDAAADAADKLPPKAKKRMSELFSQL